MASTGRHDDTVTLADLGSLWQFSATPGLEADRLREYGERLAQAMRDLNDSR
jgi:hypothetical protein